MRKILLTASVLSVFPLQAFAGDIEIKNAHAFATTPVQKHGAVFMEIVNAGDTAQRVVSASTDVSQRVELHTHMMEGDVMKMRQVDGYDVPAASTVELKPASHHIMLLELNAPLEAGTSFPITLNFETHSPMVVDVAVKKRGE